MFYYPMLWHCLFQVLESVTPEKIIGELTGIPSTSPQLLGPESADSAQTRFIFLAST